MEVTQVTVDSKFINSETIETPTNRGQFIPGSVIFANGMLTDVFAVYTETLDNSATVVDAHWAKAGGKWQREAIAAFPKAQQGTNPLAPKVYCVRLGCGDWIAAFVHPVGDRIRRVGPIVKIKVCACGALKLWP